MGAVVGIKNYENYAHENYVGYIICSFLFTSDSLRDVPIIWQNNSLNDRIIPHEELIIPSKGVI